MSCLIISYKNRAKRAWDLLPILLSFYNAFRIPLDFTFSFWRLENLLTFDIIEIVIDVVFVLDLILMFLTTYQNKRGFEIKSPYKIASNYVRTWRFVFDCLSILGNTLMRKINPMFRYFKLFKASRVL